MSGAQLMRIRDHLTYLKLNRIDELLENRLEEAAQENLS